MNPRSCGVRPVPRERRPHVSLNILSMKLAYWNERGRRLSPGLAATNRQNVWRHRKLLCEPHFDHIRQIGGLPGGSLETMG